MALNQAGISLLPIPNECVVGRLWIDAHCLEVIGSPIHHVFADSFPTSRVVAEPAGTIKSTELRGPIHDRCR